MITTVIMAGGKGTRVTSISSNIPKPMIPLCGKPVLEYQIDCLKKNGLIDIIIVVGYFGQIIKDYFGDGVRFGCNISYYTETKPLGTAGALFEIKNLSDCFLLVNGDIVFDIDFNRMISFHNEKGADVTLAVHPNNHPYDSTLLVTDSNNRVIGWINKEEKRIYFKNQVNSGIHIVSLEFLKQFSFNNCLVDFDRDLLKPRIKTNNILAYHTPEYIKDMGTPERYEQVISDIVSGKVMKKNLTQKQKCVFLDRDGTINVFNNFIKKPNDFSLLNGAAEAIKIINDLGYLAIVITNQPVIARGEVDIKTLNAIHMKMESELAKSGAYIDDLFYCPHHPDKGFPGELSQYKIDCDCRKPKPGLIFEASKKYNIDLGQSYMAGDDLRDIEAGIAAGCIPVYLSELEKIKDTSVLTFENLLKFSEYLFSSKTL